MPTLVPGAISGIHCRYRIEPKYILPGRNGGFTRSLPSAGLAESLAGLRRELERAEEFHKKLQGYYEVGLRRK